MKLSLHYPVYPFNVNQSFGENYPCVKNYGNRITQEIVMGCDNVTCPPGYEKLYPKLGLPKGHDGIDLMAGEQPCYASCEGKVTQVSYDVHRGLGVYVTSEQEYDLCLDKPYRVSLVYWHFKEDIAKVGDCVKVGDILGVTDSTGASSGNHLHFEVIPVIVDAYGRVKNAFTNDFRGAIDPMPFFNGRYASVVGFTFKNDMKFGQTSEDVKQLQLRLISLGYSIPAGATSYYGYQTKQAVYAFQEKNVDLNWYERYVLAGNNCGDKTRAALNKSF